VFPQTVSLPAIQRHALACIVSPTGRIQVREWVPSAIPGSVRRALADCEVESGPEGPTIDPDWGEPGLTAAEKVFGWSSFTVLACEAGNPKAPVNAIPPSAWARCQVRFVVGVDQDGILPALRNHLDQHGFTKVRITPSGEQDFAATRLDPDHPWARWAAASLARTNRPDTGSPPEPGASLPNDIFSELLDLPTTWVPHSYPGCSQHAPNEHLPVSIAREGLAVMAGLYWDLAEPDVPVG